MLSSTDRDQAIGAMECVTALSHRLPARYVGTTLADHDPARFPAAAKAHAAAESFVAGDIANLVLVGPPGVGKTMLAAGICHAVASKLDERYGVEMDAYRVAKAEHDRKQAEHQEAAWQARMNGQPRPEPEQVAWPRHPAKPVAPQWLNVPAALVGMRLEIGRDERATAELVDRLRSHEAVVVLDDLGREKVSDWTAETIYVLVNDRYEDGLDTIVTSNLTMAELAATGYWPAISRLAEDGRIVEVTGPDQRLRRPS